MTSHLKVNDTDISIMTIQKSSCNCGGCGLRLRKRHTVPADAIVRCAGARAQCTIDFEPADKESAMQKGSRIDMKTRECIATVTRFAHKTYAPATDASH